MSYTGSYATPTEFKSYALSASAVSAYTDVAILSFLSIASDIADSYIRSQYPLPLAAWGQDLKMAVIQIAALLILTHRGFDPSNPADAAIHMADASARKWLSDVSAARATLQVVVTAPGERASAAVYSRPSRGW